MRVQELTHPPSIHECLVIGQVASEAFLDDPVSTFLSPPRFRFGNLAQNLALIREPEVKLNEIQRLGVTWKYNVWLYAWKWYSHLSRPGTKAYIGYNDQNVPVGVSIWSIPAPLRPKPSAWQSFIYWLRKFRAKCHHVWLQWWYPGLCPRSQDIATALFEGMEHQVNFNHTEEREQKLLAMSPEDRRKSLYTEDLSYYLMMFCVSEQGKGHGSKLFREVDTLLNPQSFVLDGQTFEPQKTLMASPMGLPLYKKFGFRVENVAVRQIEGFDQPFQRDLMVATV